MTSGPQILCMYVLPLGGLYFILSVALGGCYIWGGLYLGGVIFGGGFEIKTIQNTIPSLLLLTLKLQY
jgi:hypothetical protein